GRGGWPGRIGVVRGPVASRAGHPFPLGAPKLSGGRAHLLVGSSPRASGDPGPGPVEQPSSPIRLEGPSLRVPRAVLELDLPAPSRPRPRGGGAPRRPPLRGGALSCRPRGAFAGGARAAYPPLRSAPDPPPAVEDPALPGQGHGRGRIRLGHVGRPG